MLEKLRNALQEFEITEEVVAKGKKVGRPKATSDSLANKFWEYYQMSQREKIIFCFCNIGNDLGNFISVIKSKSSLNYI